MIPINDTAFRQAIEKALKRERDQVLGGNCSSLDAYKHHTGIIRGLEQALGHFKDALKTDDDD